MKTVLVKEVMVPLEDYATVSENATLFDAVTALDEAQKQFDQSRYRHRAILVYNDKKEIVGKLSQMDLLKALEPSYQVVDLEKLSRFGYSLDYLQSVAKTSFWDKPLHDICKKTATLIVKDFMHNPKRGEYIVEDATLDEAIHQLIIGKHHSLLVTKGEDIVGILRLTDVFAYVYNEMKACGIK